MLSYQEIMDRGGFRLPNKIVFGFSNNAVKFLDGLTTNDMSKPINAFLDRLGKIIALADQKIVGDDVYIVIEEKYKDRFLDHISNFLKFSKVKMEQLNLNVVHIVNKNNKNNNHDKKIGSITIDRNIGYLSLLENLDALNGMNEIPDKIYEIIRIENNIPVQGIDFDNVMFLETGLYDSVSFTKGCYLGQEIIARVHHKGKPARKLARILYDELPEDDNVKINGEIAGKITSKCFSPKYGKYLAFAMIKDYEKEIDCGKVLE